MIFSISDITISVTLILNVSALISSKVAQTHAKIERVRGVESGTEAGTDRDDKSTEEDNDEIENESDHLLGNDIGYQGPNTEIQHVNYIDKARNILLALRRFSFLLIVYNLLFFILMTFTFNDT